MRLSQYFLPTMKETPSDAQIASHRLMVRTGMIVPSSAGIYTWLPLGLKVLQKIETIVREEQNRAGAIEVLMPTIQSADLWKKSGRYDAYGQEMLRLTDRHDREMLYTPTAEELITDIASQYLKSYRDLPKMLYQIQWKFRDEIRPRFGIMRGREFYMKDCYSFDLDYDGALRSYQKMLTAYVRTFARMGLVAIPVKADSGAIGGDLSQEFQVLAETGESLIYYDQEIDRLVDNPESVDVDRLMGLYAAEESLHDPARCPVPTDRLKTARGIEVGHIFYFGTKYADVFNANVMGPDGVGVRMHMGSYGIGVSRLIGAIIEANHDDRGILWPDAVTPFQVGIVNLKGDVAAGVQMGDSLYDALVGRGIDVLYDDRTDVRPGAKFADMDLIGLPVQIIIGAKGIDRGVVEVKCRRTGAVRDVTLNEAIQHVCGRFQGSTPPFSPQGLTP